MSRIGFENRLNPYFLYQLKVFLILTQKIYISMGKFSKRCHLGFPQQQIPFGINHFLYFLNVRVR